MTLHPAIHHRRSLRLKGYDYRQAGAYFVTVCTHDRLCLFGDVVDGDMRLDEAGQAVADAWQDLPNHYRHVALDAFVVMPNHIHGIVFISPDAGFVGAGFKPAPTSTAHHGLPEIVRGFKTFSSRRVNALRHTSGSPVWQRNYYEHIIRSEASLAAIREYIANNPLQWALDRENPINAVSRGET